jgi:hypothetical protein
LVLKGQHTSESSEELAKLEISGLTPRVRSGLGAKSLHFQQVPGDADVTGLRNNTLRTTGIRWNSQSFFTFHFPDITYSSSLYAKHCPK